ncbi:carbohydrate ABC transporter permease [Paenibacillus thermoaerophilus]|uniref:Carbohydrate ABC transporter permease n=1 Tax=Paenibacillus thermoaerophilus TaxID=1215385 RepID=A0ABW2V630_9BACL|nr:carbohydrate ABC transporter permease [Paenibacillus thermoaerophilus]TMV05482.1 carbohydrate ABC transporter permease [Paenibacillus thermoaerophilus]
MPTYSRANRAVTYALLTLFSLFFLIPIYVMAVTSFKSLDEVTLDRMWELPSALHLSGYGEALKKLAPNLLNSVYLAVPATVISCLLGSLNGYVFAKWKFRGSDILFVCILFGMFIPYQSILIPLIQFMQAIRLYNTIPGLILVHVIYGIPITTLIFRNFYAGIPTELLESAKIDGAGFFGIYRHIFFPLSMTGFVVVGIWQFTSVWNEFLFAVTLTTQKQQPIMVALQNLSGSQVVHWNVQMAGALLAALPTLLVYVFLSRYFVKGLLAGSIKG